MHRAFRYLDPARSPLPLAALLSGAFILLAWISLVRFDDWPPSMDEYTNLYQAQIFASGRLAVHSDPSRQALDEKYMFRAGDRLFSKYPPAVSAIMAPAVLLGVTGLTNPLISVVTLLLFNLLAAHFLTKRSAWLITAIVATNPWFLAYGASYFSQPAALVAATSALLAFFSLRRRERTAEAAALGAIAAAAVLIRPLDAVCFAVTLSVAALDSTPRIRRRALAALSLGCICGLSLLCSYYYIQTGMFMLSPTDLWRNEFVLIDQNAAGYADNVLRIFERYLQNMVKHIPHLLRITLTRWAGYFFPLLDADRPEVREKGRSRDMRTALRLHPPVL